jgi:hypothetical protein
LNHDLSPTQALLLFGLLARHGKCAQADLMPKVKKADREALARAKLIAINKLGRGYTLILSDAGWAWAAEHLSVALPRPQRTLSDLLLRLGEHLKANGETLADFIGAQPEPDSISRKRERTERRRPPRPQPLPAEELRERIEKAYLTLTNGRKNQAVRLRELRAELADLSRATLDAALLRILRGDPTASLMRHDDPRQLDQGDQDAAFNPSGEPFHVIWISS